MQVTPKILKIFVVALIVSLTLAACGGGTTGSTWFNLPSVPIKIQSDDSVTVFGQPILYNSGLLAQLQSADIQKLEVRIGYNGIHIYTNGNQLPYVAWDAESMATVQEIVRNTPQIPSAGLVANLLPVLRQIGLGVSVVQADADVSGFARWSGETSTNPAPVEEGAAIGPFQLGGIAFDEAGNLSIGSMSAETLGLGGPLLDANTLGLLRSYGMDNVEIATAPDGIKLSMNGSPLPGIAYDSTSLGNVMPLVQGFAPDLAPTLSSVLPLLPNTELNVAVSFTGEPVGGLQLSDVPVALNDDGTLSVFGMAMGATPVVPVETIAQLQAAGVEQLNVEISGEGVFLASNGQTLPTITWTPENMQTLAGIVAPLAGIDPEMIANGMALIEETGAIKAAVAMPGVAPSTTEINKTLTTPSAEGIQAPVIHADAVYSGGSIQSVGGLPEGALPGIPLALPPNVTGILDGLDAQELALVSAPGKLNLLLDGSTALTINYDDASLATALNVAGPFLAGTPLENPAVATLVEEQILPLVPIADLDITMALN